MDAMVAAIRAVLTADWTLPAGVAASDACRDLLGHMLERDPARRIKVPDILSHPCVAVRLAARAAPCAFAALGSAGSRVARAASGAPRPRFRRRRRRLSVWTLAALSLPRAPTRPAPPRSAAAPRRAASFWTA